MKTQQARVSIHSAVTPKVPECTQRQRVSENILHLRKGFSQSTSVRGHTTECSEGYTKDFSIQATCPVTVAEPTQYTILGLPIVHLSLAVKNPPWILREAYYQRQRPFVRPVRPLLAESAYSGALTQEPWVIQTVLEGYHIPLLSAPLQPSQRMQQYWRRWRYSPSCRSRPCVKFQL